MSRYNLSAFGCIYGAGFLELGVWSLDTLGCRYHVMIVDVNASQNAFFQNN